MENKVETFEADDTGAISASSIQVPGIIRDSEGHEWTIPEEDPTSDEFKLYKSPFDIKKDPQFHYQFEHRDKVSLMMAEGFAPCTRKELGIPDFNVGNEYGTSPDGVYRVEDLVCIKIPKIIADRKYAAQDRMCKAAVAATEPQAKDVISHDSPEGESLAKMRSGKGGRKYEMSHQKVRVKPKNPDNEKVA